MVKREGNKTVNDSEESIDIEPLAPIDGHKSEDSEISAKSRKKKQKTWKRTSVRHFDGHDGVVKYIKEEKIWSYLNRKSTAVGEKVY